MAFVESLIDNFDDFTIDLVKWPSNFNGTGNVLDELDGKGSIVLGGVSGSYSAYYTSVGYDLTGSYAHVKADTVPPDAATNAQAYIKLELDANNSFIIGKQGANLYIQRQVANVYTTTTIPYDTVNHGWWRIRESAGNILWDTSADGLIWTNRSSFATPFIITSLKMQIGAGTFATQANPGSFLFDNFNIVQLTSEFEEVKKTYLYKVYNSSNVFLGTWSDVVSDLEYQQELYSSGSSINVELARNSDTKVTMLNELITTSNELITTTDGRTIATSVESANQIGPGSNVDVNHRVEIWVFYGTTSELITTSGQLVNTSDSQSILLNIGAVNGLRKFHGYITRYVSRYGSSETTQVTLASFGRELDNYVLESGVNTTVTYNSTDPSNILKDALDKFTLAGGRSDYGLTSVALTSTIVSYTFRVNTYLEVIKKCIELAPYDWYWYVGLGDDIVYFQDRPTTAAQTFILGKHIEELNLEYSIEDITNKVYFTGAETAGVNLFKKYTDATSITNYRQGLQRITDNRVTLAASADLISNAEITRNSTPRYRTSITILNTVYDIENIVLGQLVAFRNFGNYVDALTMQIVGLNYKPDKVTLQLDTLLPSVNKRVEDLRRAQIESDNQQAPTAPS